MHCRTATYMESGRILLSWRYKGKCMVKVKEVGEVYRCEICGNVVEVKEVGGGEIFCCGQPMKMVK